VRPKKIGRMLITMINYIKSPLPVELFIQQT